MKKYAAGDPNRIHAPTWNALVDEAQRSRDERGILTPGVPRQIVRGSGIIEGLNNTGADVPAYSVLAISGVACEPRDPVAYGPWSEGQFLTRPVVKMRVATADDVAANNVAITLDGIPAGMIGPVAVDGVTPCRVLMGSEYHRTATLSAGVSHWLTSGTGPVQILYVQAVDERPAYQGETPAWCMVRLGVAAASGDVNVWVKKDGGVAGGVGVGCDFTYSIWLEGDDIGDTSLRLATGLTPTQRRWSIGEYLQAPDGTLGKARYYAGAWELLTVYREVLNPEPCEA